MNSQLEAFARESILKGLRLCTPEQQHLFKRMYSPHNLEISVDDIVPLIDGNKLDWAMQQIDRTILKNKEVVK